MLDECFQMRVICGMTGEISHADIEVPAEHEGVSEDENLEEQAGECPKEGATDADEYEEAKAGKRRRM